MVEKNNSESEKWLGLFGWKQTKQKQKKHTYMQFYLFWCKDMEQRLHSNQPFSIKQASLFLSS